MAKTPNTKVKLKTEDIKDTNDTIETMPKIIQELKAQLVFLQTGKAEINL